MEATDARILIISQRNYRPTVCRCNQNEFQDVITDIDHVDLIAPGITEESLSPWIRKVQSKLERSARLEIHRIRKPIRTPITKQYELAFVIVQHPSDLDFLDAVPGWREHSKKAVIWVEEFWQRDLVYSSLVDPLKQFDHLLTNCGQTCAPLQNLIGIPCVWEGSGIDTIRFCPHPHPPQRVIDFHSIGRRSSKTHEALRAWANQAQRFYTYDTGKFLSVMDHQQHREQMAHFIKRARFFLANKAKVDQKMDRGEQEEVGLRFFEGAAGGAILVGDPPNTTRFHEYFDWPDAFVTLPFDATHVADILAEWEKQPQRLEQVRRDNVVNSLLRHDWVFRWERILNFVGLPPHPKMAQRKARLEALADMVRKEGPVHLGGNLANRSR